jgi:hypothetical protein
MGWVALAVLDECEHVVGRLAKIFIGGYFWKRNIVGKPVDSQGISDSESAGDIALVASVVLGGWAYVPSIDAMGCHVGSQFGRGVYDDASAGRGQWGLVEVETAVEAVIGGEIGLAP